LEDPFGLETMGNPSNAAGPPPSKTLEEEAQKLLRQAKVLRAEEAQKAQKMLRAQAKAEAIREQVRLREQAAATQDVDHAVIDKNGEKMQLNFPPVLRVHWGGTAEDLVGGDQGEDGKTIRQVQGLYRFVPLLSTDLEPVYQAVRDPSSAPAGVMYTSAGDLLNPTMSLYFAAEAHPSQVGWWIGPQPHNDLAWLRNHGTVRSLLGDQVLGSFTALGTGDVGGGLDRVIHNLEVRPERAPSPIPQGHPKSHPSPPKKQKTF
jgi:hypothetical protein